jgi:hypothetical protein
MSSAASAASASAVPWSPPNHFKSEEAIKAYIGAKAQEKIGVGLVRNAFRREKYYEAQSEVQEEFNAMLAAAPPGAWNAWEAAVFAAKKANSALIAEPIIRAHRETNAAERAASPPDPPDAPQVVIDGMKVSLLYKSVLPEGGYPLIIYRCGDELSCAYPSKSEGLWRLLVHRERGHDFLIDKGHNYTTTTQIHMDLQPFFSSHFAALPEVSCEAFPYLCKVQFGTDYYNKIIGAIGYESPPTLFDQWGTPILTISPRPEREYKHPVFEPLNIACDENCFANTFNKIYENESAIRRVGPTTPYIKKLQELFGIGVRGSIINSPVFRNARVISKEDRYQTVVAIFSAYMKHFFRVADTPSEYRCTLQMPIESGTNKYTVPIYVYRTTITLDSDPAKPTFFVYYGVYTMPDVSLDPGTYKIILNILPTESKMGAFGLHDMYISANIYVYKMFEYATIDHSQVERQRPQNIHRASNYAQFYYNKYKFMGDLLAKMWPLEAVREGARGGFRKKRTRRNRRKSNRRKHR